MIAESRTKKSVHLHFIGVAGTAMGNVAMALKELGLRITGSDAAVYPPMSDVLSRSGVEWYDGWRPDFIVANIPDAVVVGNAISRGNVELEEALNRRFSLLSMPEVISRYLLQKHTSIVVSGTHGKTTTSSLAAVLLEGAGLKPGFLIGAVVPPFGSGCRPAQEDSGIFVIEGDEYDTAFFDKRSKFLSYRPDIAIINNIEYDHADIFGSLEQIVASFRLFARLVPQNGVILAGEDDNVAAAIGDALAPVEKFGLGEDCFWRAVEIDFTEKGSSFSLLKNNELLGRFFLPMTGIHSVTNATAALAAALHAGAETDLLREALAQFTPPKRRMEVLSEASGITVIDDFAHHPTAIFRTIEAVRQKYKGRRLIVGFEPRSNTTTRNIFQEEIINALAAADIAFLGATNRPERYAEEERLSPPYIVEQLRSMGKEAFCAMQPHNWGEELHRQLLITMKEGDVLLLCSNGNFDGLRTKFTTR